LRGNSDLLQTGRTGAGAAVDRGAHGAYVPAVPVAAWRSPS
jgi:hypothetical protein